MRGDGDDEYPKQGNKGKESLYACYSVCLCAGFFVDSYVMDCGSENWCADNTAVIQARMCSPN